MTTQVMKALEALSSGEIMNYDQIHEASGVDKKDLTNYMRRLLKHGFVEHMGYLQIQGRKQPMARFQISASGLRHLDGGSGWSLPAAPHIEGESIVARAIRTQPNSVFSLGGMQA